MRGSILLILLQVVPYVLQSQVTVKNDGLTVNNTVTGTWEGINIPRNVKTSLIFTNNSITSVNSAGYLLQAGDEGPLSTNNNLDGAVITGNRLNWSGTDATSITHGMFMGYNINYTVKYNYLDNTPYGILFKSGTDAGSNMTYSAGYGASYNIVKNAKMSLRMKGINGVQVYNNTFYSNQRAGSVIFIDANHDRSVPAPSTGARIKNNIFYTVYQIPNIAVESGCLANFECDYNVYYCESGSPVFTVDGAVRTFSQWQAMGYDQHSVVVNPGFINTTGFVPSARLDYGTDLGSAWVKGISPSASWSPGIAPSTADQNGKWQVGAVVYPQVVVTTPPVVTPPPVTVNNAPVINVNFPAENLSGFIGELDASGSYDPDKDNLSYAWVIPSSIPVSASNNSKIRFLSPAVSTAQTYEFTLKVSDGKTTQQKTISIRIIPYKPELESAKVKSIEASSSQSPYFPYNIADGNIGTMWSANGDDQWLIMELDDLYNIQHVSISFKPDQKSESYFDVLGSENREAWEPILVKSASCGFSGDLQVFEFPASKSMNDYRYIKLVGHSNSADSWNYISEFKVFGFRYRNPSGFEDQPVKLFPNPASDVVNFRIDNTSIKPDFVRIVSMTGKMVYEKILESGIQEFQVPVSFKQGIYIVQMGSGNLTLFTQKLVINI